MDDESEQKAPSAALRGWVRRARADCHMSLRELDAIADKIDNELVELPKDADGVPIHVGDTVYETLDDEEGSAVKSITLYEDGTSAVTTLLRGIKACVSPADLTHTSPDSLESIASGLDDMVDDMLGQDTVITSTLSELRDFADRIRKLAKEQGDE